MTKKDMSLLALASMDEEKLIKYLQGIGILKESKPCEECKRKLILQENEGRIRYRCPRGKAARSVRDGSIFSGSGPSLKSLVAITHLFVTWLLAP